MIERIDLNDMQQVLQLLELQQIAYRIEAKRIGFDEIPPLFDSPQSLRDSQESFFGYFEQGRLAGAIGCRQSAKELAICRLMVHPDFFRRGIAGALLQHIESLAVPGGIMTVSTGTNNTPAVQLYEKYGFEAVQMQLLAPGITMTKFMKAVTS